MTEATVLIPTHDHADTLRRSIASVRDQTVQDFELFVVGDGAPPRTDEIMRELCAEDERIRYFPHGKGPRHGERYRHEALEDARGRIVCYLCDDDLWLPHHLETMVNALTGFDFVHTIPVVGLEDRTIAAQAGDLADPAVQSEMKTGRFNLFGPTCAGHTLAGYRNLPHGWHPAPPDLQTDLHMWRQWLAEPGMRFCSVTVASTLHLPTSRRTDWSMERRLEEMDYWAARIREPGFRDWLTAEILRQWRAALLYPNTIRELAQFADASGKIPHAAQLYGMLNVLGWANPANRIAHARMLMRAGRTGAALEVLRVAAKFMPSDPRPLVLSAKIHMDAERFDEAETELRRALVLGPDFPRVQFQLAQCLRRMGRHEEALAAARRAVELAPAEASFRKFLTKLEGGGRQAD